MHFLAYMARTRGYAVRTIGVECTVIRNLWAGHHHLHSPWHTTSTWFANVEFSAYAACTKNEEIILGDRKLTHLLRLNATDKFFEVE